MSMIPLGLYGAARPVPRIEWFGESQDVPNGASAIVLSFAAAAVDFESISVSLGTGTGIPLAIVNQPSSNVYRDMGIWWVENPTSAILDIPGHYKWVFFVRGAEPGEIKYSISNNPSGGSPTPDPWPHTPNIQPGGLLLSGMTVRSTALNPPSGSFIYSDIKTSTDIAIGSAGWTLGENHVVWPSIRYNAAFALALNLK